MLFRFSRILSLLLPPVIVATTATMSLIEKTDFSLQRTRCTFFDDSMYMNSSRGESLRHQKHKLGFLLVDIAEIWHFTVFTAQFQ